MLYNSRPLRSINWHCCYLVSRISGRMASFRKRPWSRSEWGRNRSRCSTTIINWLHCCIIVTVSCLGRGRTWGRILSPTSWCWSLYLGWRFYSWVQWVQENPAPSVRSTIYKRVIHLPNVGTAEKGFTQKVISSASAKWNEIGLVDNTNW